MSKLALVWVAILALSPCQKFRSQFSEVALHCGLDSHAGTVVQILDPDGHPLSATGDNVKASWLTSDGGTAPLPLNTSGCTVLPHEAGVLEVGVRLPAGTVRHNFSSPREPSFEQLKLIPSPALAIHNRCSDDTIYASRSLFFPFSFSKSGNFSNVQISLLARSRSMENPALVWQKPFHEADFVFPEQLDVSLLQEGSYDFQLQWQELSQGNDRALSSSCRVSIKRTAPILSGFPLVPRIQPQNIAQDTILPWSSKDPEDSLWLCRKELQDVLTDLPGADCQKQEDYKPAKLIVADKSGLWLYCLVAEDKAGNRSAPYCEQLLVSPVGPELQVEWVNPELKERLPLLKRPFASIEAKIHINHPIIPGDELKKSLQCRVDFSIGSDVHATGRSVLCSSGACNGQDLSVFRACPTQLKLDLTEMWTQTLQRRSRLSLQVRANDGAGHVSEAVAQVWIHDQAWYAEPMARDGLAPAEDDEPKNIAKDHKGRPWLLTQSSDSPPRLYVLDSAQWRRSFELPSEYSFPTLTFVENGLGQLHLVGTTIDNIPLLYQLQDNDSWKPIDPPAGEDKLSCGGAAGLKPEGLACLTASTIYLWQDSKWSAVERPKQDSAGCSSYDSQIVVDEDRIWAPCQGQMWLYANGMWQRKPTPEIDVIESMALDSKGRLWAQSMFPFYEHTGIGYFDRDGQWFPTGADKGLVNSISAVKVVAFGEDQRVYFGPFVWNESTLYWDPITADGRPTFGPSAETLPGSGDQVWMAIKEQTTLVSFDQKRPVVWHLPSENMKLAGADVSFRDAGQRFWWFLKDTRRDKTDLFHLRDSRILLWDEQQFGMSIQGDWYLNDMKMDAFGQLWLLRSGRLYRYEQGAWNFQASFSSPVPAYLLPTPSGRLFLGAPGAIYEWTAAGPTTIYMNPDRSFYFSQIAEDGAGSIWFRMGDSVQSDVYRLQGSSMKTELVDPSESLDSYLAAQILTVDRRLLMIVNQSIWGFDSASQKFMPLDPTELALPSGYSYGVHALDLNQSLIESVEPDVGPQSMVVLSGKNATVRPVPLLPEKGFTQGFKTDIDGRLWAIDRSGESVFRLNAEQQWEIMLGAAEMRDRFNLDSLLISSMIPTAEGGLFLQQNDFPLLRILP